MILKNHASASIRKERSSRTNKARRVASGNKFVKKGRVSDKSNALEKSIIARMVREIGLDLLNPIEMD